MFARVLEIHRVELDGRAVPLPLAQLDSFAMRTFTNDARFDDTLPVADGLLETGFRVPLPDLEAALTNWLCRKGWLRPGERLTVAVLRGDPPQREAAS